MIIVGTALVSEDIVEAAFACQLNACQGACCVEGDWGAPLEQDELAQIEKNYPSIAAHLTEESRQSIASAGFFEHDDDESPVTRCLPDGACVFAIREDGITLCGIEQAYRRGDSDFMKPISCHLYPIRVAEYGEFTVMNYHRWDICKPACQAGKEQEKPLYRFLENALKRKMGEAWYHELEAMAEAWKAWSGGKK